jgi:cytoskeletal protein CcmA (bactofilin family)
MALPIRPQPAQAAPPLLGIVGDIARLGAGPVVKGDISGGEDLLIDGTVEGTITLQSHRLTVGCTAQLSSDVSHAK